MVCDYLYQHFCNSDGVDMFGQLRSYAARMEAFETLARETLASGWKVADYARALGCSATHLNRLTHAHAGQSPAAFLAGLRMQEARRLLAYTLMDVAEVGYRLGYEDPSYFSRAFRRETGLSPSAFRRPYRDP